MLDENGSHRCASLVYARNEEGGLRCIYHGWKVDYRRIASEERMVPIDVPWQEVAQRATAAIR